MINRIDHEDFLYKLRTAVKTAIILNAYVHVNYAGQISITHDSKKAEDSLFTQECKNTGLFKPTAGEIEDFLNLNKDRINFLLNPDRKPDELYDGDE